MPPPRNQAHVGQRATDRTQNKTRKSTTATVPDENVKGGDHHTSSSSSSSETSTNKHVQYHPRHVKRDLSSCMYPTLSVRIKDLLKERRTETVPIRSSRYPRLQSQRHTDAERRRTDPARMSLTLIEIERKRNPTKTLMEYVLRTLCCNYPTSVRKRWVCMFDIDHTIAMNSEDDPCVVYGIAPLCWLLQHVMSAGFAAALVTARSHEKWVIDFTKHSLEQMGIPWDQLEGLYFLPSHVDHDDNMSGVARWKHSIREELTLDQRPENLFDGCAFATGDQWFDLFPYGPTADIRHLQRMFPTTHMFVQNIHVPSSAPRSTDTSYSVLQYQHQRPTWAKRTGQSNATENVYDAYQKSIPRILLKLPNHSLPSSYYLHRRLEDSIALR